MSVDTQVQEGLETQVAPPQEKTYHELLNDAATQLKETGQYSTELSAPALESLMKQVVADQTQQLISQYIPGKLKNFVHTSLDSLSVGIADEKGHVSADLSIEAPDWNPHIHAEMILGNTPNPVENNQTQPEQTASTDNKIGIENLVVTPDILHVSDKLRTAVNTFQTLRRGAFKLLKAYNTQDEVAHVLTKDPLETLFTLALNKELQSDTRQAKVSSLGLQFTPQNTLRIDLKGAPSQAQLPPKIER